AECGPTVERYCSAAADHGVVENLRGGGSPGTRRARSRRHRVPRIETDRAIAGEDVLSLEGGGGGRVDWGVVPLVLVGADGDARRVAIEIGVAVARERVVSHRPCRCSGVGGGIAQVAADAVVHDTVLVTAHRVVL